MGEILGYTAMLLALSMVFFGIKRFRDRSLGGKITFLQAFLNGMIVVAVAAAMYVIGWEIYYPNFAPDFSTNYSEYLMEGYRAEGLTEAEISVKQAETAVWMERYKSPFYRIPLTLLEFLPPGILICVVSAAILKRK